MSILSVYHTTSPDLPNKVLTHSEDIASTLAEQGVVFEQRTAHSPVTAGASSQDILAACGAHLDSLMTEAGFAEVDVISVDGNPLQTAEVRAGFLEERQCGATEAWHFVAGRGLLSLHIGEFVYAVLCEKNDLVRMPAGTCHWFDMGEHPRLVAIRLIKSPDHKAGQLTGNDIAGRFPQLED
jgi:1,2-dihydroxy-3-keto-5-methylthiopentene dioxygenase